MPIGLGIGAIGAVGSIASGAIGYYGAKNAADIQSTAAQNIAAQQQQVNQQAFAPYLGQGAAAYKSLGDLYGVNGSSGQSSAWNNFLQTPAYQFASQQGNLGLDRSAASKGLLLSGGQLKDAMSFNQGLASQQIGNYTNVLQSMSQLGLNASAGYAGQFNQSANTMMGGANAQAAGAIGGANALSSGLGGATSNLLTSYGLSKLGTQNTGSTNNNPSSYQPIDFGGATGAGGGFGTGITGGI